LAQDVNQALPLPMRVSELAVGGGTEVGSEPELMILIAMALIILTISIRLRRRRFV
jgi:hypothetical protein